MRSKPSDFLTRDFSAACLGHVLRVGLGRGQRDHCFQKMGFLLPPNYMKSRASTPQAERVCVHPNRDWKSTDAGFPGGQNRDLVRKVKPETVTRQWNYESLRGCFEGFPRAPWSGRDVAKSRRWQVHLLLSDLSPSSAALRGIAILLFMSEGAKAKFGFMINIIGMTAQFLIKISVWNHRVLKPNPSPLVVPYFGYMPVIPSVCMLRPSPTSFSSFSILPWTLRWKTDAAAMTLQGIFQTFPKLPRSGEPHTYM